VILCLISQLLLTIDVSFISLALILENLNTILPAGSPVIALIKPQFEATRELVTENQGIITDPGRSRHYFTACLSNL